MAKKNLEYEFKIIGLNAAAKKNVNASKFPVKYELTQTSKDEPVIAVSMNIDGGWFHIGLAEAGVEEWMWSRLT